MTASQILHVLKARWFTVLCMLGLVLSIGFAVTLQLPREYTAKASVLLDVKSTDPILGAGIQALAINSYMATQADVLRSERVISRALRELGTAEQADTIARWKKQTESRGELLPWLVESVLQKFEVLPSRESNVITVSYAAPSPAEAASMLNAIIESYIATTIELRTEPAKLYNNFFDARAKELRAALEKAQANLSDYQRKIGVVATDERLDIENNRLSDLSSQLVRAENAAAESENRRKLSVNNAASMPDVQTNPLVAELNARLAEKQLRLKKLTTRYSGHYPTVVDLRLDIEELQHQIAAETQKVLRGISLNDDANQHKASQLRAALEAQRSKLLRLKTQRDLAAVLERDVENAERAYSAAFEQTSQSDLESQATQTNVSVLRKAAPPADASSPSMRKNLIIAFVLGTLLAVALAIVLELRDRRLRIEEDVELLLGQPLLGVLPKSRKPRVLRRAPARRLKRGGNVSAA